MVAFFVVGIAFMATSGVQVLIPETGQNGRDWIADVDDAGGLFVVGAWLVVFGGLIGLIALIGFYDALRSAGQIMVIAPIAAVVGLTLVTISHAIPIAIAYELVPDYVYATGATKESLGSTLDVLASICLITNYVGNASTGVWSCRSTALRSCRRTSSRVGSAGSACSSARSAAGSGSSARSRA